MNKEFPPFTQIIQVKILRIFMIKGRAIRKLVWEEVGGGGWKGAKNNQKKNAQGKIKLKKKKNIHTGTPGNAKKYSCKGLKKNHTRGISCGSKIPTPTPTPKPFLVFRP